MVPHRRGMECKTVPLHNRSRQQAADRRPRANIYDGYITSAPGYGSSPEAPQRPGRQRFGNTSARFGCSPPCDPTHCRLLYLYTVYGKNRSRRAWMPPWRT